MVEGKNYKHKVKETSVAKKSNDSESIKKNQDSDDWFFLAEMIQCSYC